MSSYYINSLASYCFPGRSSLVDCEQANGSSASSCRDYQSAARIGSSYADYTPYGLPYGSSGYGLNPHGCAPPTEASQLNGVGGFYGGSHSLTFPGGSETGGLEHGQSTDLARLHLGCPTLDRNRPHQFVGNQSGEDYCKRTFVRQDGGKESYGEVEYCDQLGSLQRMATSMKGGPPPLSRSLCGVETGMAPPEDLKPPEFSPPINECRHPATGGMYKLSSASSPTSSQSSSPDDGSNNNDDEPPGGEPARAIIEGDGQKQGASGPTSGPIYPWMKRIHLSNGGYTTYKLD